MPEKREVRTEVVDPPVIPRVYANAVDAMWTAHDIQLKFSELIRIAEVSEDSPKTLVYETRALVTLAWSEAKLAANLLNDVIARYEKNNGEIKLATIP